jgi:CRISPR-associated protein Cmr4
MFDAAALLYLIAEMPLHAGTGSTIGIVDLPIQRERHTQYPLIQGSSIKGVLRAKAKELMEKSEVELIFGSERGANGNDPSNDHASALSVSDARILLFPVRALKDVFVYATSIHVLARFRHSLMGDQTVSGIRDVIAHLEGQAPLASGIALVSEENEASPATTLVLEEFAFDVKQSRDVGELAKLLAQQLFPDEQNTYWAKKLRSSLVVLPDEDFRDFLQHSTEVITRVALDDKKIVKDGALWTEEHLPADTVLYVPVFATASRNNGKTSLSAREVMDKVQSMRMEDNPYLQLGGDETVGRGIVRASWQTLKAGKGA